MRSIRKPQLDLRLDAVAPDAALRWHEGASIRWLGQSLRLTLDHEHSQISHQGDVLYLPLPPHATPRQIQDSAESWLRAEAIRYLTHCIAEKFSKAMRIKSTTSTTKNSALVRRQQPRLVLSFAARSHWVELLSAPTDSATASATESATGAATGSTTLRCYWRLIEQSPELIDAALEQALQPCFANNQPSHGLFALHA